MATNASALMNYLKRRRPTKSFLRNKSMCQLICYFVLFPSLLRMDAILSINLDCSSDSILIFSISTVVKIPDDSNHHQQRQYNPQQPDQQHQRKQDRLRLHSVQPGQSADFPFAGQDQYHHTYTNNYLYAPKRRFTPF